MPLSRICYWLVLSTPLTHLGIIAEARALAPLAEPASGMLSPLTDPSLGTGQRQAMRPLAVAIFLNASDQVGSPQTIATTIPPLAPQAMPARVGGHKFSDDARNGTVRDAFSLTCSPPPSAFGMRYNGG
jgi:hypothetical protein